jgi:hypothetical protein
MAAVVQNLFERKIRIPTFHKQFESSSQRVWNLTINTFLMNIL